MLTTNQLDAAYVAYAEFMGPVVLKPTTADKVQQAYLAGYGAGHDAAQAEDFAATLTTTPAPTIYDDLIAIVGWLSDSTTEDDIAPHLVRPLPASNLAYFDGRPDPSHQWQDESAPLVMQEDEEGLFCFV